MASRFEDLSQPTEGATVTTRSNRKSHQTRRVVRLQPGLAVEFLESRGFKPGEPTHRALLIHQAVTGDVPEGKQVFRNCVALGGEQDCIVDSRGTGPGTGSLHLSRQKLAARATRVARDFGVTVAPARQG